MPEKYTFISYNGAYHRMHICFRQNLHIINPLFTGINEGEMKLIQGRFPTPKMLLVLFYPFKSNASSDNLGLLPYNVM